VSVLKIAVSIYGEERLITLGLLEAHAVVITHVERGEATRIISIRKANRREQQIYQERLGEAGSDD
jgi:uncharacterized DUF497 family protein